MPHGTKNKGAIAPLFFRIAAARTRTEGSGEVLRSDSGAASDQRHQTRIKRTLMKIQSSFCFLQEIISD